MPQDNGRLTVDELRAQYSLGARVRPPDPREWAYELTPVEAVDRTKPRSIARYAPPVRDQGAEGSCTANASAAVMEACAAIAGVPVVTLCRMWDYWATRTAEGTFPQDAGAYIADSFDVVLKNGGAPAESAWPYDAQPGEQPPAGLDSQTKYLFISGHQPIAAGNFIDGAITAIDKMQPLSYGIDWRSDFDHDFVGSGILRANPSPSSRGGHNVTIFSYIPPGYRGNAEMLFGGPNSWGPNSPDNAALDPDSKAGWLWIPGSLLQNGIINELRAAVPVKVQPTPNPTPTPTPTPTPQPVTDYKAQAMAVCIATMIGAIKGYQQAGNNYPYWRGEYDGALTDYNAIARL